MKCNKLIENLYEQVNRLVDLVEVLKKSESSASSVFTAEQRKLIGQSPSGSKIYIFDIKAKGPDGRVRDENRIDRFLDFTRNVKSEHGF